MGLKTIKEWQKKKLGERIRNRVLLMKDKRGMGIGDLYPIILTIALVSILIGIVLFVLDEFSTQVSDDSASVINESKMIVNSSNPVHVADSNSTTCGFNSFAVSALYDTINHTLGEVLIPAANYTIDADRGTIINATATTYNETNVSYSYKYDNGVSCDAIASIETDISDFVPWIGIILLVIAAAIVLGILIRNLAGGNKV